MAISNNPDFAGANQIPYSPATTWIMTPGDGVKTVYAKFFTQYGGVSSVVSATIELSTVLPAPPTPPPAPEPTPAPAPAPAPAPKLFYDANDLPALLTAFGLTRNIPQEDLVMSQVFADAREFHLWLTADQAMAVRNFIVYGISPATIKFGQRERRAISRDYMDTVARPDYVWSDIERIATGQIPLKRNLVLERQRVNTVLPVFRRLFGHDPNFKVAKENLAWNTLLYRIRFPRDMVKEANGLKIYYSIYRHNPTTPFGWSVVRVLGYIR
jgi:hypothetical protein